MNPLRVIPRTLLHMLNPVTKSTIRHILHTQVLRMNYPIPQMQDRSMSLPIPHMQIPLKDIPLHTQSQCTSPRMQDLCMSLPSTSLFLTFNPVMKPHSELLRTNSLLMNPPSVHSMFHHPHTTLLPHMRIQSMGNQTGTQSIHTLFPLLQQDQNPLIPAATKCLLGCLIFWGFSLEWQLCSTLMFLGYLSC